MQYLNYFAIDTNNEAQTIKRLPAYRANARMRQGRGWPIFRTPTRIAMAALTLTLATGWGVLKVGQKIGNCGFYSLIDLARLIISMVMIPLGVLIIAFGVFLAPTVGLIKLADWLTEGQTIEGVKTTCKNLKAKAMVAYDQAKNKTASAYNSAKVA